MQIFLRNRLVAGLLLLLLPPGRVSAIEKLPFPAETFSVGGHAAFLMEPEDSARGNPWVWYAPTLATLPDQSHRFYFERFLAGGIAVAGYWQGEVRGSDRSSAAFSRFYDAILARGYSEKPILLGQSRGGLMLLCWAFRNPGKVGAFAGIYPVCNLRSWPLKDNKGTVLHDYAMTEAQILDNLDCLNPPRNLEGLARNQVPLFLLYGDKDQVVPHTENSELVRDAYEKLGGPVFTRLVPGGGHSGGPAYFQEQALVDFVLRVTSPAAAAVQP